MFKPLHPALSLIIVVAGLLPLDAYARPFAQQQQDQKNAKDQKPKKDQKPDKAAAAQAKEEREYIKMKQFALTEMEKDYAFKAQIESAYRRKQREHSEYAFYINTFDAQDEQVTRTGDKLKIEDTLYDNPLVQDYINRLGHSLVPKSSQSLYAFKVILNPIPEARSLSTGTVYVSTGLLSLVDNEAQLAYVLSHEIAHVEKNHWHEDVVVGEGVARFNQKQEQKRSLFGGIATLAAGPLMRAFGANPANALMATLYVENGLPTILKLAIPNSTFSWDRLQEDEADQLALQYMLDRNYDAREVPKFYANLQRVTGLEKKASLGFIGDASRIVERVQQIDAVKMTAATGSLSVGSYEMAAFLQTRRTMQAIQAQNNPTAPKQPDTGKLLDPSLGADRRRAATEAALRGQLASTLDAKLDAGEIIGNSSEFAAVMAQIRRDNGIRAFNYDMFQMARDNLEESLLIKSNDALAYYYYGKILKQTARNSGEKKQAYDALTRAVEIDQRKVLAEARLYRALSLMENKDASDNPEVIRMLKDYVEIFRSEHAGGLPPNMDAIYDYMQEVGEMTWARRPAMHTSDKLEPAVVQAAAPAPVQTTPAQEQPVKETPAPPKPVKRKP